MEFDYIVVGAGSAGCAIAARLAEDARVTVALIEAGGRARSPWLHIPVGYFKTMGNPRTDWMYRTDPDPGLAGRAIDWPRGKVLGGSSAINGLLYVRGQRQDYDHWRQLGNPGWSYDDVLPAFRRSEAWEDGGDAARGGEGPLAVSRSRVTRDIVERWIRAAQAAGYAANPDYNGSEQEGVGHFQMTMRDGWRCSSARAYLRDAGPNLTVLTRALTERLEIVEGRARAVIVSRGGVQERIAARREIVLSAGAIGSPQILMLSGIGDPGDLQRAGVDPLVARPGVGRNLQDHLQARPVYRCTLPTLNTESRSLLRKAGMAAQFALNRRGPMTMAASLGVAFLKTRPELETPDIQFHIQPFSKDPDEKDPHPFDAFTASVCQLRPESTGRIYLKSRDPAEHPGIAPNYLATQADCDTIVAGIRIARAVAAQGPLKDAITCELSPGADVPGDDDAAILDWARQTATTIYHPTGTCRMGPKDDAAAVVDARLRVYGVEGLRVADASIMPRIVSGNTNAPAIMIGERAADFIREEAKQA